MLPVEAQRNTRCLSYSLHLTSPFRLPRVDNIHCVNGVAIPSVGVWRAVKARDLLAKYLGAIAVKPGDSLTKAAVTHCLCTTERCSAAEKSRGRTRVFREYRVARTYPAQRKVA